MEEPALLHQTLPSKKKASPTLVKKTSVIIDSKKDKKQNENNKFDQNNEKVCTNNKSLTSGNKRTPSVMTDSNRKKLQKKDFYSDECHDGVSDLMKRTPKVSASMGLSFKQSLQIPFSSFKSLSIGILNSMTMWIVFLTHKTPLFLYQKAVHGEKILKMVNLIFDVVPQYLALHSNNSLLLFLCRFKRE